MELLLGQRMPRRLPTEEPVRGIWPRIRAMLTDRRTWSTMFYMLLQLPLGIAYFTVAVTGLALSLSLVVAPIADWLTGHSYVRFGNHAIDSFAATGIGTALMMAVGFILFFVVLHIIRGLMILHGRYAEATLVQV